MIQKFNSILLTLLVPLSVFAASKASGPHKSKKPDRLIIFVFDQMRPDYIDRFNLKNFKRLRAMGTSYPEAYVGHSASVTIVSHLVISTGLFPKDLPWADDTMWDRDGILGKKNASYETTHFSNEEILRALKTIPESHWLATRIKKATGRKSFALGEKGYAAMTFGGPYADSIVTLEKSKGKCTPGGLNVPDYILTNPRFSLDCSNTYGTDLSLYPLDGQRYFPGPGPLKQGGDVWTADVALEIMKNEDWGALFITFGAIDKFAHMLGEHEGATPHAFDTPAHLKDISEIADQQLGRLLDALASQKKLDSTLLISTADHGGQTNIVYLGNGVGQAAGTLENRSKAPPLPFWIDRLNKIVPLKLSYQDTSIRLWLETDTPENRQKLSMGLQEISQVTRVFELAQKDSRFFYKEMFQRLKDQPPRFRKWAQLHDEELLNTMANDRAPEIVALLEDGTGFGKLGDHGGTQEKVQRIPMLVAGPTIPKRKHHRKLRLYDVKDLVEKVFQLPAQ